MIVALAAGLAIALGTGALPASQAPPDLSIRPWHELGPAWTSPGTASGAAPASSGPVTPPPCAGDVCQPRVSVPGLEPRFSRPSRTELAVVYLERARLEPFATLGWLLLTTGLRFDYAPPEFDGASQTPTRWGSVFLRVKFRVDADNLPVVPRRHSRDQRPARRSNT
jgi:hypothetical protein